MHGTVLGVWAHPDDESFCMSGIAIRAVREGRRVVIVTATRGEMGSQDHERWPPEKMAEVREAELAESLAVLGVTEHRYLDYVDGSCPEADDDEAIAKLVAIMEEVRPDSVLTFGPEGGTGHPDHIAVSRWTRAAFERAAPEGSVLCYMTETPEWAERWCPVFEPYNVFAPGTPVTTPRSELGIALTLDDEMLDLKMKALRAQVSQTNAIFEMFGEDQMRASHAEETFAVGMRK